MCRWRVTRETPRALAMTVPPPFGLTDLGDSQHVLSDDGGTSTGTPLSLGRIETSPSALNDHASLKLSKGNHHREKE